MLTEASQIPSMNSHGFARFVQDKRGEKTCYKYLGHRSVNKQTSHGQSSSSITDYNFHQMKRDLFNLNGQIQVVKSTKVELRDETPQKIAQFKCQGQPSCKMKYSVYRLDGYFGYYGSDSCEHTHKDKAWIKDQTIVGMINSGLSYSNPTTRRMSQISKLSDNQKFDIFGLDADKLNEIAFHSKVRTKIDNPKVLLPTRNNCRDRQYGGPLPVYLS